MDVNDLPFKDIEKLIELFGNENSACGIYPYKGTTRRT